MANEIHSDCTWATNEKIKLWMPYFDIPRYDQMEKVLVCQNRLRFDHMDKCGIGTDCKCWELCIWHSFLDIDECEGRNCSEQGECQDGIDDYTCNCNNGFTGKDCETGTVASQISDATEIFSLLL